MFETLLLAVDVNDPEGSIRNTKAAVDMARHQNAVLHVLNVIPDDGMAIVSSSFGSEHGAEVQGEAHAALEAWAAERIPADVDTKLHIAKGTVYDQIIKVAKQLDVSAIFVGAHSPALKDYLIGPNAARVARHASQSVFVIR